MRRMLMGLGAFLLVGVGTTAIGVAGTSGCPADLPQGGEPVTLDPADFVPVIDNP